MNLIFSRYSQSIQRASINRPSMDDIRKTRNMLLTNSDWTQLPDSPLSAEKKYEWAEYRQQLRNITDTIDLNSIHWPNTPS